jgi:RHS repeat-associated protein
VQVGQVAGWTLGFWGSTAVVTGAQSHSGGYSLAESGSVEGGSYQDIAGLVPGVSYTVSVWVKADAGTTAQANLWVHDTVNSNTSVFSPTITPGTSWQPLSVTYVADSTGKLRIALHYLPGSGTIYFDDVRVAAPNPPGFDNHYKFTGKERDAETGLDYFRARYYSNGLGRFTTMDPIHFQAAMLGDPQRFNLYAYVRNNPLAFIDPQGKSIELTGDADQRREQLDAAKSVVGAQAGTYLYENKVDTTDANGNTTTRYFIGILTNGPDGKGPDFGAINPVAADLGSIINNSQVGIMHLVKSGDPIPLPGGDTTTLSSAFRPGDGLTYRSNGTIQFYVRSKEDSYKDSYVGFFSTSPWGGAGKTQDTVLGHELGRVLYLMNNPSGKANDRGSDKGALDLENKVRKLQDPQAPVRTKI